MMQIDIELGGGTTAVGAGVVTNRTTSEVVSTYITFQQLKAAKEIGDSIIDGNNIDAEAPAVKIRFKTLASLEVVEDALKRARLLMEGKTVEEVKDV